MQLFLNENVHVSELYFGGSTQAGASAKVFVNSDKAIIDKLHSGSVALIKSTPETCELTYSNVGIDSENPYILNDGVCLDGLTKLILESAVVDLSQVGNTITVGEIDASNKSSIIHRGRNLTLNANYKAGTSENPTIWYGQNAPRIVISGTVSGTTRLQSLSADPSAEDGGVTGKFYNGIFVTASHIDTHSADNFFVMQSSEVGELVWRSLTFTSGTETDTWEKIDEGDTLDRIQVYVSSEGSDSNGGTFPSPVLTLNQAYIAAEELYKADPEKKKIEIILLDDIVHNGNLPASTELSKDFSVLVKSNDAASASTLTIDSDLVLPVDTTFDNIIIKSTVTTDSYAIFASGNDLTCTQNLKVEAVSGHYPVIYGGTKDATALPQTNLKIFGGTWSRIFGGSKTASVDTVNLLVGGSVDTKNVGSIAENVTGVFGGGENGTVGKVNLRIDGGSFYRVLGGGLNRDAVVNGDIIVDFNQGTIDRLYGGGQNAQTNGDITVNIGNDETEGEAIIEAIFRGSGLYAGVEKDKKATTNVNNGANIQKGVQFAAGGYSGSLDDTVLNISGGIINCDIFAGGWGEETPGKHGNVSKSTTVNISGGTIDGDVYGGGNLGLVHGADENAIATVYVTGGTISGNVYGGGNAAGVDKSKVTVESGAKIGLNVYGGSYNIEYNTAGDIQKTSEVILKGAAITGGCVFGGSNLSGDIKVNTNVTVPLNTTANAAVYGGGNMAGITGKANVVIDGALTGKVFGGGKGAVINGTLTDANAKETSVTINGTVTGDIYGGGELATVGDSTATNPTGIVTHVTLGSSAELSHCEVFGGGCGESGNDYATIYGSTSVVANGGTADENSHVFGGGQMASVKGDTNVTLKGGTFVDVFGGNEMSGDIAGATNVTIPAGSRVEVAHLFGGGLEAAYNGTGTNVSINGGNIVNAYGGGFGDTAAAQRTNITVTGGRVDTLYGGGDEANVTEAVSIEVSVADKANEAIGTLYCGNNKVPMEILPKLNLKNGKIGTLYGGGNAGNMTVEGGLVYDLKAPNIEIGTVYGGCNAADVPGGVKLTLTAGKYGTVYGGNNASGAMPSTVVTLAGADVGTTTIESDGTRTTTGGLYGGGNQAETGKTEIILESGTASNVYGGGNEATVTESVTISTPDDNGTAKVTNLFCGNNMAPMSIHPNIDDLKCAVIDTFYGGGNAGAMTNRDGLTYTFNNPDMYYNNIIGGCKAANVASEKGVTLILNNVSVKTAIYAGCDVQGKVQKTEILICGDVSSSDISHLADDVVTSKASIFGGGRGELTTVGTSNIHAQNGTVNANIYGGSGFGRVNESNVTVTDDADEIIVVKGNVFGGGYGESSTVKNTNVIIDTKLSIYDLNSEPGVGTPHDLKVTEQLASTTEHDEYNPGATYVKVEWATENRKTAVSRIEGNVYGGGDMGQVGNGTIYSGTNTAKISEEGYTHVQLLNGYIEGDIFGGGSGKPAVGLEFSPKMGTVFGTCRMDIKGGYVTGNVYGAGYQSRVYANPESKNLLPMHFDPANPHPDSGSVSDHKSHENVLACQVNIIEDFDSNNEYDPIIIGTSVFAGGAKGEDASTNPTVYTVIGDVEVNIIGHHGNNTRSTAIYFEQDQNAGGGVYGDGNLCFVNGNKVVNILCFNAGYYSAGTDSPDTSIPNEDRKTLKTFFSLQRANTVNVCHSKFVLRGAKDLVDEHAGDTLYSINRVEQLNMYENSTIKLENIVNLLGGIRSDEHAETRYINRGNNGRNNYITRGGVGTDHLYDNSGKNLTQNGMYDNLDGSIRRVLDNNNRIIHYRNEYMKYLYGEGVKTEEYNSDDTPITNFATLKSFNEICVANGKYLEIKKSDTEYGDVKGVFILSLLYAEPGAGGGFVYASIGDKGELNSGSTGAFVCVTKDTTGTDASGNSLPSDQQPYMIISHNVGGYRSQTDGNGDYSYYYWYIKGNKYVYDMDIIGYIGTADTDFENTAVLTEMEDRHYILKSITGKDSAGNESVSNDPTVPNKFYSGQLIDYWNPTGDGTLEASDKYALELKTVRLVANSNDPIVKSIGFLSYEDGKWGIKKADTTTTVSGKADSMNQNDISDNDLISAVAGTTNLELMVVLHKGSAVQTEIRNVPVKLEFEVYTKKDNGYNTSDDTSSVVFNLSTSIVRLVPTQDVFLNSGRIYAGVPSNLDIRITGDSAFTVQYITKFMPSAFNTADSHMSETLTTAAEEIYLLDAKTGIGFTLNKTNGTLKHVTKGAISEYAISSNESGYTVTYTGETLPNGVEKNMPYQLKVCDDIKTDFNFPKGTMITMIAQIDSYPATYWYYYCSGGEKTLNLTEFTKMNSKNNDLNAKFNFVNASGGKVSYTASQRITENLSFIFDFSKTDLSAMEAAGELIGQLRLLHTYNSGTENIDIMDAVTYSADKDTNADIYTRNHPVISKTFTIVNGTGNLKLESVTVANGYSTDTFDVNFKVTEDTAECVNTRYGEREYSVLLERDEKDSNGKPLPFPAGTTFTYGDELLELVNGNSAVFVPIKTTGDYTVTMETPMVDLSAGKHTLKATVYSSQDAYFYNELNTGRSKICEFTVAASPTFALSVKQPDNIHLYSAGDAMQLTLTTQSETADDPEPISVKLFKYNRNGKNYTQTPLTDVLTGAQENYMVTSEAPTLDAMISESAESGTYRLEFRYHDRTEYWDFIIKKPE